jgi:hypothetical protein
MINATVDDIFSFMNLVNKQLLHLDLDEEGIDIDMATRYVYEGYTVEQAVDDVCHTLEIMIG